MTTITGKYQITLPKRLVEIYGLNVGDEVELVAAGDTISIVPARMLRSMLSPEERLRLFDEATERVKRRAAERPLRMTARAKDRGWTREELYEERVSRDRSR